MGAASVALIDNPLRFQGQYYDDETKLHYNRFRYYSPRLGRYWSVDPLGLVGGHNLYTYVGNDPVNRTDPLGLWWETAVAIGAGLVAAAAVVAIVVTAPISLPVLAVGALAVMAGVGVGLGVHEGITHYEETGEVCVSCILSGFAEGVDLALVAMGAVAVAALIAPEAAAFVGGVIIGYGLYSFGNMLFNWDNMTHEERMEAVGGILGGVAVGLAEGAVRGARPSGEGEGFGEGEGKGKPAAETPEQRYSRLKSERLEQQRQQALREQIAKADEKGKLAEIDDPADQEFLKDPKNKDLAYDPDTKSYKPDEARTARQAEDNGTLKGPVRRAMPGVNPDEAGADYVDGNNNPWDVKDASHGADNIAQTAKNGENVLVDGRNLSPAERTQLQNDINQRLANDPNAGQVKVVGENPPPPAKASKSPSVPPVTPPPHDESDNDDLDD